MRSDSTAAATLQGPHNAGGEFDIAVRLGGGPKVESWPVRRPVLRQRRPKRLSRGEIAGKPVSTVSRAIYDDRFPFRGFYIVRPELRGRGYGAATWRKAIRARMRLPEKQQISVLYGKTSGLWVISSFSTGARGLFGKPVLSCSPRAYDHRAIRQAGSKAARPEKAALVPKARHRLVKPSGSPSAQRYGQTGGSGLPNVTRTLLLRCGSRGRPT